MIVIIITTIISHNHNRKNNNHHHNIVNANNNHHHHHHHHHPLLPITIHYHPYIIHYQPVSSNIIYSQPFSSSRIHCHPTSLRHPLSSIITIHHHHQPLSSILSDYHPSSTIISLYRPLSSAIIFIFIHDSIGSGQMRSSMALSVGWLSWGQLDREVRAVLPKRGPPYSTSSLLKGHGGSAFETSFGCCFRMFQIRQMIRGCSWINRSDKVWETGCPTGQCLRSTSVSHSTRTLGWC